MSTLASERGGLLRRWVGPLVDPAVFDYWVGLLNRGWTWNRPLARVVERRVESSDAVTLVLKPNRHWQGFRAGQHLNVGAEVDGRRITRSYSLSDRPRTDGRVAVTVKRVTGGRLSNHLCDRVQVGDWLFIDPAYGELNWPGAGETSGLFLAAGSGITPLMSLTRAWVAAGSPGHLTLVYWARNAAQACFAQELRELAASQPRFQFHLMLTQAEESPEARIHADQLTKLLGPVEGWSSLQVLACGPGGFVETARQLLASRVRRFQAEAFSPPAPIPAGDARPVTLRLRRSGQQLTVSSGDSLLGALEAHGLRPPSGCRMGICHSCVCTKHEGTVQNLHTGEREAEPGSQLRLCVSRACGDLSLDL